MKYSNAYNSLTSLVSQVANDLDNEELFRHPDDLTIVDNYYRTLRDILMSLPTPEKEDTLLTTVDQIRNAGLIKDAAWKAKVEIIKSLRLKVDENDADFIWTEYDNLAITIEDLLAIPDEVLVEKYLKEQGGFYSESKRWIPF